MKPENLVKGGTEAELWQKIRSDFSKEEDLLAYNATLVYKNRKVALDIDIDPGGGFESGSATTAFVAWLPVIPPYRFAIHEQHFTDEIGKFFGMEDVLIGYRDFDEKLVIKAHDKATIRKLFASPAVRETFMSLHDFTFGIHHRKTDNTDKAYLELYIEHGITEPEKLQQIFNAFYAVLELVDDGN